MYPKDDKRILYWLIDQFLLKKIDESTFCDEFYYSFDLEIDANSFTHDEKIIFEELNNIVSRFSPYEEDHLIDSKVFSTNQELQQKIIETKNKLTKISKDN